MTVTESALGWVCTDCREPAIRCEECGEGQVPGEKDCPKCHGTGEREEWCSCAGSQPTYSCSRCDDSGLVSLGDCGECNGTGGLPCEECGGIGYVCSDGCGY